MARIGGLGTGPLGRMPLGRSSVGMRVFINKKNFSDAISRSSPLRFTNIITSQADKATFVLEGIDEADVPVAGQEVIMLRPKERVFGGIIAQPERIRTGPKADRFLIKAQDFSKLLVKRLVTKAFINVTAGAIIKDVVQNFVLDPRINTDNVQDGPVVSFAGFNFATALAAIKKIAKETQREWFIDPAKRLFFFSKGTLTTPFDLVVGEFRYRGLRIRTDASQIKNRITVRGGTTESATFSETKKGDTSRRTWPVAYRPTATPTVKVNGGAKTIGIKNTDDGTKDFLFEPNDNVIENDQQATLGAADELEIEYKFKIPVLAQVEDPASQTALATIEGSDGIYEEIIVDSSIESLDGARERGLAELVRFGTETNRGSFETFVDGFRSGQLLRIDLPDKNLDFEALVTKVTFTSFGCGRGIYRVEFGTFSFEFQDFLLGLIDRGREISVREGEVLDDLLTPQETIPILDQPATFVQKSPPFTWGAGGANDTQWNFGQWA